MLDTAPVAPRKAGRLPLVARISSIARWVSDYIEMMASYYAAATMYEQLSKLSDAELQRRGLSRHTLATDVMSARVDMGRF